MRILCNKFWVKYPAHWIQDPIPKMKGHEFNSPVPQKSPLNSSDQNELVSVF